jgi:predicted N-acetyltransferase YhbS
MDLRRTSSSDEREPGQLETDSVAVRSLQRGDAEAVARIDERITGRSRRAYFEKKIEVTLREAGISLSLVAEIDRAPVGFLVASVDYGQFGVLEPVAVLDAIGVHPDFRDRRVGSALLRQLALNLRALHIQTLRTEVDWRQSDLAQFLQRQRFLPAARLCLEARVEDLPLG